MVGVLSADCCFSALPFSRSSAAAPLRGGLWWGAVGSAALSLILGGSCSRQPERNQKD